MAARFRDLLDSALQLPPGERSQLAAELIASLDGEAEAGNDATWLAEIDRRRAQAEDGEAQLVERESVTSEVRESLRRG